EGPGPSPRITRRHLDRSLLVVLALRRRGVDLRVRHSLRRATFRMNMPTTLREGFRSRFVLWVALGLPIAARIVHLSLTASLAHQSCGRPTVHWFLHALTAVTALVCIGCGLIGYAAYHRPPRDSESAPRRFLGGLIVALAAVNLVLILWE